MNEDLGGFKFDHMPKVEVLSSDVPRQISLTEAGELLSAPKPPDTRRFEINPEGAVKASGYTPDEVAELLRHYREHMTSFARTMQELSAAMTGPDNPLYTPGGYQ